MKNEELLEEFFLMNNHKPGTKKVYISAINKYCEFNDGMTMKELIEEAENEEEQGIRWKHSKLKKRLLQYRQYLITNYKKNSVSNYLISVKAVYKYFDIEIGDLKKINPRGYHIPQKPTFDELLTHEEISQVLHAAPLWFQAFILFQISTGCARKETMQLTIGKFKEETYPFHRKKDILEALEVLKEKKNIIPTFKLKREKTNKYYYTFCTPEALDKIVEYLLTDRIETLDDGSIKRIDLDDEDKLFNKEEDYIPIIFSRYNELFDFGKASDGFNRFRSHMMRKFHSNHLKNDGMSESDIDALQGRGKSSTRAAYFLDDPNILLKKYVDHFQCLLIESTVNNIDWKSPEYQELEAKYNEKEAETQEMKERLSNIEKILFDIDQKPRTDESVLEYASRH